MRTAIRRAFLVRTGRPDSFPECLERPVCSDFMLNGLTVHLARSDILVLGSVRK